MPAAPDLLVRAAERGANLGAITVGLQRLLDRYGAAELQAAITEALARDVPHPNAVRLAPNAAVSSAARHPPSPSRCQRMCAHATCPCSRIGSNL